MSGCWRNVVLLSGGVGGARFAEGLNQVLPEGSLTIVANVGDDEDFYGLRVCPDLDTLLYTLSNQVDRNQGWGVARDTTKALEALETLGAPAWMRLGDSDFGLHIWRSWQLGLGLSLTEIFDLAARRLDLGAKILPASDHILRTKVLTENGLMDFQAWFVGARCEPKVISIRFDGADKACASSIVLSKISQAELILFAPSNPLLSIEPILAVGGIKDAIARSTAPRIGVSPLIKGQCVKGPLGKLLRDIGLPATSAGMALRYEGLLDGFVVDPEDVPEMSGTGFWALGTNILMSDRDRSASLAEEILEWASAELSDMRLLAS